MKKPADTVEFPASVYSRSYRRRAGRWREAGGDTGPTSSKGVTPERPWKAWLGAETPGFDSIYIYGRWIQSSDVLEKTFKASASFWNSFSDFSVNFCDGFQQVLEKGTPTRNQRHLLNFLLPFASFFEAELEEGRTKGRVPPGEKSDDETKSPWSETRTWNDNNNKKKPSHA